MTRRISLAIIVGVLLASGAYLMIYLFRWEWHRAIITGIFFLAAELALAVVVMVRRLTRLELRLDQLGAEQRAAASATVDPAVLQRIQDAAPPARQPFAWLDPRGPQGTNVFLPFLLGVGAIASGLAWVVEHVARRTTTPVLEHRLAAALAPLSLPAGGLVGPVPVAPPLVSRPRPRWLAWIGIALVASALAAGTIDWLADALQTRPDTHRENVTTTVEVQFRGAFPTMRPERAASELWGTCAHVLKGRGAGAVIEDLGGGRVAIMVPNDIGHHGEQRLRGCLHDTVVDRVQASVVSVEATPQN